MPTLTESGILPPGVTFVDNKNGTGTLSGTATPEASSLSPLRRRTGSGSPAALAFTLTVVSSVPASGTKCNGVYNGTFKGNIVVGPGQSCTFMGGGVTGSVTRVGRQRRSPQCGRGRKYCCHRRFLLDRAAGQGSTATSPCWGYAEVGDSEPALRGRDQRQPSGRVERLGARPARFRIIGVSRQQRSRATWSVSGNLSPTSIYNNTGGEPARLCQFETHAGVL